MSGSSAAMEAASRDSGAASRQETRRTNVREQLVQAESASGPDKGSAVQGPVPRTPSDSEPGSPTPFRCVTDFTHVPPLPALDGSNQLWASDETAPQQATVDYGTQMPSMPVVEGADQQWAGDKTMPQQSSLEYGQTKYVYVPVPVPIPV